nr:transmembrane protein 242 isoform X1 [Equus caballus]
METGRQLAAPATPPRGGETKHVILSGAGSATARALRPRAGAPGSRTESAAPARGCRGRPGRGARGGSRAARPGAPRSLLPHRSQARARRAAGGGGARLRAAGRAPQTLVCKAQPGARAALRAGPPPPGRVGGGPRLAGWAPPPAPPPRRRCSAGPPPQSLPGGPVRPRGRRWGPLASPGDGSGRAPAASPRCALSNRLLSASRFLLRVYSRQQRPPRDTHSHCHPQTHSCDSRGPEEAARRGDPRRPAPALPPPAGRVVELRGALLLSGNGHQVKRSRMLLCPDIGDVRLDHKGKMVPPVFPI